MKKSNNNDNEDKNDNKNNSDNNNTRSDSSIFYIMDGIIDQLNKTKKLFIIMLLNIMIIPPIAFMLTFMLLDFCFMMMAIIIGQEMVIGEMTPVLLLILDLTLLLDTCH